MNFGLRTLLSLLAGMVLALLAPLVRADTPVSLFQSIAGHVNFTGTEATMRTSGTSPCLVTSSSTTLSKTLSTIPSGSVIQAAYLYWAGSGSTADTQVTFNGSAVTAQRKYAGSYVTNGVTYSYFSGVADVTATVKSKGNSTYTFKDLTINSGSPYCDVEGVLGGFALLVVYSHPNEPFRVLNLYEGFQYTRNSSTTGPITLNLSNFRVPDPLNGATGRIGHITWEGDVTLNQQGENLSFNGTVLTDSINPAGNQFNSASNINGDKASYGIDFDAYTISDPIIKAGDSTATTTYASGQDLVWLNVEIVAVPNVPTVDLATTVTRSGTPALNGTVTYTINVSNNGPDTEVGTITLSNQLPDGMSYGSVSGAGWNCSYSGQIATCSNDTDLAAGQSLAQITITATVKTMYSSFVDAVAVSGTMFDNVSDNNNATDVWSNLTGVGYMFTDRPCSTGYVIGAAGSNCLPYNGPYTAASVRNLYITYHNGGIATAYTGKKGGDTASMRFGLVCTDPKSSTVRASYAGQSLPLCTSPTSSVAWSGTVTISFAQNAASGTYAGGPPVFVYKDVGQVQLYLNDTTNNITAFSKFISVPKLMRFTTLSNSNGATPDDLSGFARAGETVQVAIKLEMDDAGYPPNFGNESVPHSAGFAVSGSGTMNASLGAQSGGIFSGTLAYHGLGSVDLKSTITSGSFAPGTYFGLPIATETRSVGIFYPGFFKTTVSGGSACLAHMNCPSGFLPGGENKTVSNKFIYSGQSIDVNIQAFSLNETDVSAMLPALDAFSVTLSAVSQPGSTGVPIGGSTVNGGTPLSIGSSLTTALPASVPVTMPNSYSTGNSRPGTKWDKPTPVYLRAEAPFVRKTSSTGTTVDTVSSNRGASALTAGVSGEGGIEVVQGRLLVDNANGSELIKLPLYLHAQYWTGTGWENNGSDTSSIDNYAEFSNCTKNLVGGGSTPCKSAVTLQSSPLSVTLDKGRATLWMAAPGAGNNGSVIVTVPHGPPWLPSTAATAVFGTYKSKFIYIREVY